MNRRKRFRELLLLGWATALLGIPIPAERLLTDDLTWFVIAFVAPGLGLLALVKDLWSFNKKTSPFSEQRLDEYVARPKKVKITFAILVVSMHYVAMGGIYLAVYQELLDRGMVEPETYSRQLQNPNTPWFLIIIAVLLGMAAYSHAKKSA